MSFNLKLNYFLCISVLSRVKVRFIDTVIRLEHVPLNSSTGVAVEMWIQNLEYSDEAGLDPSSTSLDPDESAKGYIISAFSTKRFYMEGVTFHTDEFPSHARTFSRSLVASTCSTPDSKVSIKEDLIKYQYHKYDFKRDSLRI